MRIDVNTRIHLELDEIARKGYCAHSVVIRW